MIGSPARRTRRSVEEVTQGDQHDGLRGLLHTVRQHLPGGSPPGAEGAAQQTLTLQADAAQVLRALADPKVLSRLLGELGSVEEVRDGAGDGLRWTLAAGEGHDGLVWVTELQRREGGLRHTGPVEGEGGGEDAPQRSLDAATAPAPRDLGTEVRLRLDLPLPRLAAGAAAFTVLYRLRALLQTGEIPTLRPQPAARDERG